MSIRESLSLPIGPLRRNISAHSIDWEKVRAKYRRMVVTEYSVHSSFQTTILPLSPDILIVFNAPIGDESLPIFREKYKFIGVINTTLLMANLPVTNVTPRTPRTEKKILSGSLQVGNLIILIIHINNDSISDVKKFLDEIKSPDIIIIHSPINITIENYINAFSGEKSPYIYITENFRVKNIFTNLTFTMPKCIDICV